MLGFPIEIAAKLSLAACMMYLAGCAAPPLTSQGAGPLASAPSTPAAPPAAAPKGRRLATATSVEDAIKACPEIAKQRDITDQSNTMHWSKATRHESVYYFVLLCSDDPAHGWAYFRTQARTLQTVTAGARYVSGGTNSIEVYARNSAQGYGGDRVAEDDTAFTPQRRERAIATALPPLVRPPTKNLVPEGYVWPDGSPMTNAQMSIMLVTEIMSKSNTFQSYLPSIVSKYERSDLEEIGRIPLALAKRDPLLLAVVEKQAADNGARSAAKAAKAPANFTAIDEAMRGMGSNVPNLQQLMDAYGPVAPLDKSSACAASIYDSVAKLARNHETMVLRPRGTDLNYFKDQYRYLFQASTIANLNTVPDMDIDAFKVTDGNGTKRSNAVAIVPNANCTAAYVRIVYFGGTTNWKKYYAVSSARVEADFLKRASSGRVSQQLYRVMGFSDESGRPQDFAYSCDADTCQRRK